VALAGVIAAMRITKTKMSEHKYLFQGAGEVCRCVSVPTENCSLGLVFDIALHSLQGLDVGVALFGFTHIYKVHI